MSVQQTPQTGDDDFPFACCGHCGCGTTWGVWPDRNGHDATCAEGCNDEPLSRTDDDLRRGL